MMVQFIGGPLDGARREVAQGCRYVEIPLPREALYTGDMSVGEQIERILNREVGRYEVTGDITSGYSARWSGTRPMRLAH